MLTKPKKLIPIPAKNIPIELEIVQLMLFNEPNDALIFEEYSCCLAESSNTSFIVPANLKIPKIIIANIKYIACENTIIEIPRINETIINGILNPFLWLIFSAKNGAPREITAKSENSPWDYMRVSSNRVLECRGKI